MRFWLFMTACCLLIPASMIFFGRKYANDPPKQISQWSGYRTAMSIKNADTWEFAHRYFGKAWYNWGWWVLIGAVVCMCLCIGGTEEEVGLCGGIVCATGCIAMCIPILMMEKALKREFHIDGTRRICPK